MQPIGRTEGRGSGRRVWLRRVHIAQPIRRIIIVPMWGHTWEARITCGRSSNLTL